MRTATHQGKRVGTVLIAVLLAFVLTLIAAPVSQGQSSEPPTPPERTPQADDQGQPPGPSGLLEKAEREGSVKVTVGLRTDFEPEGKLERSAVDDQRDRIKNAQAGLRNELQGTGYRTLAEYDTIPFISLEVPPQALQAIERSPRVTSIDENVVLQPALAQSVPKVQAPTMWNSGYAGAGQTVAVLDSGVETTHPFLANKVVQQACFASNLATANFADGLCPNGSKIQTGPGSAAPCDYKGCDHGTHVAGIAAGKGTNSSGVAKGASIMAVQVFGKDEFGRDGANSVDQIAALDLINKMETDNQRNFGSVNMSLYIPGLPFSSNCNARNAGLTKAIKSLKDNGVATVISSGNDGFKNAISFPACISHAVSVGNTTKSDTISTSSNSASFLSLLAPGTDITSSVLNGQMAPKTGTSMAAPHVAGAWAVLKQKYPTASVDSILSRLKSTGTPVKDTRVANGVTKPRINIAAAAGHPTVTAMLPAPGSRNVDPTTSVRVTFSEPMDPTTVNTKSIILRRDYGNGTYSSPLSATVTYYAGGNMPRTAVLNPTTPSLVRGATYVATVFPWNKDLAGNPLAEGKFWRFVVSN